MCPGRTESQLNEAALFRAALPHREADVAFVTEVAARCHKAFPITCTGSKELLHIPPGNHRVAKGVRVTHRLMRRRAHYIQCPP